jgi:mannose-6-phosphate isomerase-like protein (cupin superfamily)
MKLFQTTTDPGFRVTASTDDAQTAMMILAPGETTGGGPSEHPRSDQWLYVVSGRGEGLGEGQKVALEAGALLHIPRGESHEIRNTGDTDLVTLNVYVPPAYSAEGEPLQA